MLVRDRGSLLEIGEPVRFSHRADRVFHVCPFSAGPRPLSLVPRSARAGSIRQIEIGVREACISLQNSRRKVRLDLLHMSCEHLEVRNLAGHKETETLLHEFVVGELQQVFINDLGA